MFVSAEIVQRIMADASVAESVFGNPATDPVAISHACDELADRASELSEASKSMLFLSAATLAVAHQRAYVREGALYLLDVLAWESELRTQQLRDFLVLRLRDEPNENVKDAVREIMNTFPQEQEQDRG